MIMRQLDMRSGEPMALPPGSVVEVHTIAGNSLGHVLMVIWPEESGYAGVAQWGAVWAENTVIPSHYAVQTALGASADRVREQLLARYEEG